VFEAAVPVAEAAGRVEDPATDPEAVAELPDPPTAADELAAPPAVVPVTAPPPGRVPLLVSR